MKLYIILIILGALIQTSFLPVDLVLLILISRGLVVADKENFYLAFISGVTLGLFQGVNLGFYPLIFLTVALLTYLFKKSPLSSNLLVTLPLAAFLILGFFFSEEVIFKKSFSYSQILIETIFILPIYVFIRFWEERFIVSPNIKLKI